MSKQIDFIAKIAPPAMHDMAQTGILASLTIAQAILESSWGASGLTVAANNLFGIKGKYKGQSHKSKTFEYYNGKRVEIVAEFRKYPGWQESLNDHSSFIKTVKCGVALRYKKVIGEKDYKLACKYIQQAGYATAPTYASTLIKLIEDYKLYEYDKSGNAALPKSPSYYPACKYDGVSIVEALHSIQADFSFGNRSKIAKANNISGYRGLPKQNMQMLELLKNGQLKK